MPVESSIYERGTFEIPETLNKGYQAGSVVYGVGSSQWTRELAQGDITHLYRDTDSEDANLEPLVSLPGTDQGVYSVSLHGRGRKSTSDRMPLAGIEITRPDVGDGIGTGKHDSNDVYIDYCKYAVMFGREGKHKTANGDNCAFRKLSADRCEAVAAFFNTMAMGNSFQHTRVGFVQDVFRVHAGGKMYADDTFIRELVDDCALLHLIGTETGPNNKGQMVEEGIGENNAYYELLKNRADKNAGSHLALLRMDKHFPYPPNVKIAGGHISYDHYKRDGKCLFYLRNPFNLSVRIENLQAACIWYDHDPLYPPGIMQVYGSNIAVRYKYELCHRDSAAEQELQLSISHCCDTKGAKILA